MSQVAVEHLLGRMLTDDTFRMRAAQALQTVCREEGFVLSEEELYLVGKLDLSQFDEIAYKLNGGLRRCVCKR